MEDNSKNKQGGFVKYVSEKYDEAIASGKTRKQALKYTAFFANVSAKTVASFLKQANR